MNAGSATEIAEFDMWMAHDWWRNLQDMRGSKLRCLDE